MDSVFEIGGRLAKDVLEPLQDWYAALDGGSVFYAVVLVAVFVLFRKAITSTLMKLLMATARAIGLVVPDHIQETVFPAVQTLIISLVVLIAIEVLNLPDILAGTSERILSSIAVTAIFVALFRTTDILETMLGKYRSSTTALQIDWLIRLVKAVVGLVGITAVLKVWSIDLGPVLTGMGVLGAAVALAAQDMFKNLLAGFTNLSEKRFQVGDWVKVDGKIEGVVEKMEFRSTLIRRFDKAPVYVPNADLANNILTNFSRMPHRRIYWNVGIKYSATTEQLRQICDEIRRYMHDSPEFVSSEQIPLQVRIDELAPSAINLLIYCFTVSSAYAEYMIAKENLVVAIRQAVAHAGTSFAYPSQSVYIEKMISRDQMVGNTVAPQEQ